MTTARPNGADHRQPVGGAWCWLNSMGHGSAGVCTALARLGASLAVVHACHIQRRSPGTRRRTARRWPACVHRSGPWMRQLVGTGLRIPDPARCSAPWAWGWPHGGMPWRIAGMWQRIRCMRSGMRLGWGWTRCWAWGRSSCSTTCAAGASQRGHRLSVCQRTRGAGWGVAQ